MNWKQLAIIVLLPIGLNCPLSAAEFQTVNFQVTAESADIAQEIAESAEQLRSKLARNWLDQPLADWSFRCAICVSDLKAENNGWTSYRLLDGHVTRLGIRLNGPPERLLEYVLPHEVTHAILVSASGTMLPRWADEGAAMLAESAPERLRQRLLVEQLQSSGDLIPLSKILKFTEYPREYPQLQAFYAESLVLTDFLISRGGHARFLLFVKDGQTDWDRAIKQHYQLDDANALESAWKSWIVQTTRKRKAKQAQSILAKQ